jgi:hypothetical protein
MDFVNATARLRHSQPVVQVFLSRKESASVTGDAQSLLVVYG